MARKGTFVHNAEADNNNIFWPCCFPWILPKVHFWGEWGQIGVHLRITVDLKQNQGGQSFFPPIGLSSQQNTSMVSQHNAIGTLVPPRSLCACTFSAEHLSLWTVGRGPPPLARGRRLLPMPSCPTPQPGASVVSRGLAGLLLSWAPLRGEVSGFFSFLSWAVPSHSLTTLYCSFPYLRTD